MHESAGDDRETPIPVKWSMKLKSQSYVSVLSATLFLQYLGLSACILAKEIGWNGSTLIGAP